LDRGGGSPAARGRYFRRQLLKSSGHGAGTRFLGRVELRVIHVRARAGASHSFHGREHAQIRTRQPCRRPARSATSRSAAAGRLVCLDAVELPLRILLERTDPLIADACPLTFGSSQVTNCESSSPTTEQPHWPPPGPIRLSNASAPKTRWKPTHLGNPSAHGINGLLSDMAQLLWAIFGPPSAGSDYLDTSTTCECAGRAGCSSMGCVS